MNRESIITAMVMACLTGSMSAQAQIAAPPPAPQVQLRAPADLDQILGPIALYPDPLLAQMLPAATLPPEIVLADRYVNGGGDLNLIDQQPWDPSIKALARYPTVLKWMDDNLAWTTALGQAFLYQQPDVMASIQRLRAQALALGNLQGTPQQEVINDNGTIEIVPANPATIYVPLYQPDVVYYQRPYGSPFVSFGLGFAIGAWLHFDFDWGHHNLIVWGHDHPRPADWWYRRPSQRPAAEVAHIQVWQPRPRAEVGAQRLDRGWEAHPAASTVTIIGGHSKPAEAPRSRPANVAPNRSTVTIIGGQPKPAAAAHSRPASGALIGVQSSHETHEISNRGRESRQAIRPRPAAPASHASAPAHSEAPSHSGGGGKR